MGPAPKLLYFLIGIAITSGRAVAQGSLAFEPGTMSTVAGTGTAGYSGDSGSPQSAQLSSPHGLTYDAVGNLYIADTGNQKVRVIVGGLITTLAPNGFAYAGPLQLGTNSSEDLFVNDDGERIIETPVATGVAANFLDSGGKPTAVALDSSGNAYIADANTSEVYAVKAGATSMTAYAGGGSQNVVNCRYPNGIPALSAAFMGPKALRVDAAGNVYVLDCNTVRVIYHGGSAVASLISAENPGTTPLNGYIYRIAGTGSLGNAGDGGLASSATFSGPTDLALDSAGDIFVADAGNYVVRKISILSGLVSTVVGNRSNGYNGDAGPATSASLGSLSGIVIDPEGDILLSDTSNNVVRQSGGSGQLTFGTQQVGTTSAPLGITLVNRGNDVLKFSQPPTNDDYGSTSFSVVSGNTCGVANLAPGASCVLYVTFTPTATGTLFGELLISDGGLNAGHAVALRGGGTSPIYYDVDIKGEGEVCATGAPTIAIMGLYDSGDHQNYLVEPVGMPGKTYTYLVKDALGTNVEVDECPVSSGSGGPGCEGSVHLQRPVVPGVSTLIFWTDKNPPAGKDPTDPTVIQVPTTITTTAPDGTVYVTNTTYSDFYYPNSPLGCSVYVEAQGSFEMGNRH